MTLSWKLYWCREPSPPEFTCWSEGLFQTGQGGPQSSLSPAAIPFKRWGRHVFSEDHLKVFSHLLHSQWGFLSCVNSLMPRKTCDGAEGFPTVRTFKGSLISPTYPQWQEHPNWKPPHFPYIHQASPDFSSVWTLWCQVRWELWLKSFPHSLRSQGFSPVRTLWCLIIPELKAFPQVLCS